MIILSCSSTACFRRGGAAIWYVMSDTLWRRQRTSSRTLSSIVIVVVVFLFGFVSNQDIEIATTRRAKIVWRCCGCHWRWWLSFGGLLWFPTKTEFDHSVRVFPNRTTTEENNTNWPPLPHLLLWWYRVFSSYGVVTCHLSLGSWEATSRWRRQWNHSFGRRSWRLILFDLLSWFNSIDRYRCVLIRLCSFPNKCGRQFCPFSHSNSPSCFLGNRQWPMAARNKQQQRQMPSIFGHHQTFSVLVLSFLILGYSFPNPSASVMLDDQNSMGDHVRVAHIGNSIQYYNDCPRLLERMMKEYFGSNNVSQDSCLRGGASLVSIWTKGNGMANKFATPNAQRPDGTYDIGSPTVQDLLQSSDWDYVIMNDHTQSPARQESRDKTIQELVNNYLPALSTTDKYPTVVFLMTAAYRKPVKDADQLGSYDEFTEKLKQGYTAYQAVIPNSMVAPVGLAFQHVRNHYPKRDDTDFFWEMLYARDDFHPSPHGTLLEAFILFATIVGKAPPVYSPAWWDTARYMQPPEEEPLPLPTEQEGKILRSIACSICHVGINGTCREDDGLGDSSRL